MESVSFTLLRRVLNSFPTTAPWGMGAYFRQWKTSQQGWEWPHSTLQDKKAEFCEFGLSEVRKPFFWGVCYTLLWSNFLTFQLILSGLEQLLLFSLSCIQLCDPMDCSRPGFPVHHYLPEFAQIHVHWVSDAIQPAHPLSAPSPPALNFSQHQGLF